MHSMSFLEARAVPTSEVVLMSSQDGSRVMSKQEARFRLCSIDMDDGGDVGGKVEEVGVGEIRVFDEGDSCGDGCEIEHEEWRTMKEHIDLECRGKKVKKGKDLKNIAGSIWGLAASARSCRNGDRSRRLECNNKAEMLGV